MKNRSPRQYMHGFTLIELMITVAIVGILASIAYPSYVSSVQKGKRAEGRAALMELMQQQERYMTQRNTYAGWTNPDATTGLAPKFKTFSGDSSAKPSYKIKATDCSDGADAAKLRECVKLVAEPQVADAQAGSLWIKSTGEKGCSVNTTGPVPPVCWK